MSTIIKRSINGRTYLYEAISYRNEDGQSRSKHVIIAKINPETGETVYHQEYLDRMASQGTPVEIPQNKRSYTESAIRNSKIKKYGAFYLFRQISEQTGLLGVLKDTLPNCWQQVFNIACYLVASGGPIAYCFDWIDETESIPCKGMSPAAISELFKVISDSERMAFFQKWAALRSEQEYLALDITSVSSYSELIQYVERGYNRDKENLPQINLCLLMGEQSGLPVFQAIYSGSLGDVSTLRTTLRLAAPTIPLGRIMAVLDKGFCSIANINAMLDEHSGLHFLIAVPFSLKFAKEMVESERQTIDDISNTILVGEDCTRGVCRKFAWSKKHNLFAQIYFNPSKAIAVKEDLYANIASIIELNKRYPKMAVKAGKYTKYLNIKEPDNTHQEYRLAVRDSAVKIALAHSGWLVILSNHIKDPREAIFIYRAKDVVEKGFLALKTQLDLGRLRVHSDSSMHNKVFVCFIALIIRCRIHRTMLDSGLYMKMTMARLILVLEKLKVQYISGNRILFPLTKEQKKIFDAFGMAHPQ